MEAYGDRLVRDNNALLACYLIMEPLLAAHPARGRISHCVGIRDGVAQAVIKVDDCEIGVWAERHGASCMLVDGFTSKAGSRKQTTSLPLQPIDDMLDALKSVEEPARSRLIADLTAHL